jgi:hypothetical protein
VARQRVVQSNNTKAYHRPDNVLCRAIIPKLIIGL